MPDEKKEPIAPPEIKPEQNHDDDEEEIDIHIEKPREELMNKTSSVFDNTLQKRFGGINSNPSIFKKGVLFQTDEDEYDYE
jgi:hypothetical protein